MGTHIWNNKDDLGQLESAAVAVKEEIVQDAVSLERNAATEVVARHETTNATVLPHEGVTSGIAQAAARGVAEASSWLESMNSNDLRADAHSSIVEGRSHNDACCHGGIFSCGSSDSSTNRP